MFSLDYSAILWPGLTDNQSRNPMFCFLFELPLKTAFTV